MASPPQSALPFRIQVLDGDLSVATLQDGQPAGRIELRGRQMPYRPMSFETRQRVKTTYYPGNPVATQQVIGPTEEPSVFNGMWKDLFLGDGAAMALKDLFEDICRRGPLVEVSWGAGILNDTAGAAQVQNGGYVRRGILTRFKTSPERPQDIAWEMEFTWRGTDDISVSPISATDIVNPREGALDAVAAFDDANFVTNAFKDLQNTRLYKLPQSLSDQLDNATQLLTEASKGIQSASDTITNFSLVPADAVERLIGAYAAAESASRQLRDAFLNFPKTQMQVFDDAADLLGLESQILTLLSHTDNVADVASRGKAAAQQQVVPIVVAEVRAVPGSDLRALAQQFYGDPDLWTAIARFNGLTTSEVPAPPDGPSDDPYPPIRIPRQDASSSLFDPNLGC